MMSTIDIINGDDLFPIVQYGKNKYISFKELFGIILNSIPRESPLELCLDKQKEEIKQLWKSLLCLTDKINKAFILAKNSDELSKATYCKVQELELRVKELEARLDAIDVLESRINELTLVVNNLQLTNG